MNLLAASIVLAGASLSPTEKDHYHLFNPTPRELMRDMTTDRPDATESPFTVDAGHVQIELSFLDFQRDGRFRSYSIAPTNVRVGVLNDVEFAIIVEPYLHERSAGPTPGTRTSDSGFGHIELRTKINLWGNDEGAHALAVMPFVILPTASGNLGHNHVEGGVIVPFAIDLDDVWSLGAMAQFAGIYDDGRDRYDLEFLHTVALGRDLIGPLGGYIEYIGIASTAKSHDYQILLGAGVTYAITDNLQLDAGVNIGLVGDAPDLNPFVGMSVRF